MAGINWGTGTYSRSGRPQKGERFRVTVAADWYPMREFAPKSWEHPLKVYGDLLEELRSGDLGIVNVECSLGDAGAPILKDGPNLQADERALASLSQVPFHLATLANNHAMDYGPKGLEGTIRLLNAAGIRTVGGGMTGEEAAQPVIFDIKGHRLAVINCAEGEECLSVDGGPGVNGADALRIAQMIRECKGSGALVLVIFHGGRETAPMPPPYAVRLLRSFAEAGADAVIGHHPHVPQGLEIYAGVPIAYSQGNFLFWQNHPSYFVHSGYIVHLDFDGAGVAELRLVPYRIFPHGLERMNKDESRRFLRMLAYVSDLLRSEEDIRAAWHAFIDELGVGEMVGRIESFIEMWKRGDRQAMAKWKNSYATPAHAQLFADGFFRAAHGTDRDAPEWARRLVRCWQTAETAEEAAQMLNMDGDIDGGREHGF